MLSRMVRALAAFALLFTVGTAHADTLEGEPDLVSVDVNRGYAFAVGKGGAIYSKKIKKGEWHAHRKTTQSDLLSVSVVNRKDVWVVGIGGMFIHFDGEQWVSPGGETSSSFRAVALRDRRRGIAVGDRGAVRQYVTDSWQSFHAMLKKPTLYAIARVGRGRAERYVAVGAQGSAVAFAGIGASLSADIEITGSKQDLVAIDACASSKAEAVAVGAVAALRGKTGKWSELPAPPEPLTGVAVECKRGAVTRVFATGASGVSVYDADAKEWTSRTIEGVGDGAGALSDIDWVDRKRLIVVGAGGVAEIIDSHLSVESE
jgi:photosystem II stability/assembly factor-like uncharacterized protein